MVTVAVAWVYGLVLASSLATPRRRGAMLPRRACGCVRWSLPWVCSLVETFVECLCYAKARSKSSRI